MKNTFRTIVTLLILSLAGASANAAMLGYHLPEAPNLQIVEHRPLFSISVDPQLDMELNVWSPVALYENRLISILFGTDQIKAAKTREELRPFYAFAEEIIVPEYDVDVIAHIVSDRELGKPDFTRNVLVYYFSSHRPLYSHFYKQYDMSDFEYRQYEPTKFTLFSKVRTRVTTPRADTHNFTMGIVEYREEKPPKPESRQGYLILFGVAALFFLRRFRKIFLVSTVVMAIWVIYFIFSKI